MHALSLSLSERGYHLLPTMALIPGVKNAEPVDLNCLPYPILAEPRVGAKAVERAVGSK